MGADRRHAVHRDSAAAVAVEDRECPLEVESIRFPQAAAEQVLQEPGTVLLHPIAGLAVLEGWQVGMLEGGHLEG